MSTFEAWLLRWLWLIATLAFLFGIALPIMTIEKFWLLQNRFSILSAVWQLWVEGRYGLLLLIGCFSLLLPLLKLAVIGQALLQLPAADVRSSKLLHWIHAVGRWSMLDVFVVAVMVVSVKLSAVAAVQMHAGLYAFALSILLTMLLTGRLLRLQTQLR